MRVICCSLIVIAINLASVSVLRANVSFEGEAIGVPSVSVVPAEYDFVFVLKKDNTVSRLRLSTRRFKKLPGEFKKIKSTKGIVYALSFTNEIYKFNGVIWVKLPLNFRAFDFEIGTDEIFYRRKSGVWHIKSLIKGDKKETKIFPKNTSLRFVYRLPDGAFLTLDGSDRIFKIKVSKKTLIASNVNEILHVKSDTIIYSLLNKDILIKTGLKKAFKASVGNNTFHSVGLLSSNRFFAATNTKLFKSDTSFEKSAGFLDKVLISAKTTKDTASSLYSGGGLLFFKSLTGDFFVRVKGRFKYIPGKLLDIAVGGINDIYALDAFGNLLRFKGKNSRSLKVNAVNISASEGSLFIINKNKELLKYNRSSRSFNKIGQKAERVFLENPNTYWLTLKDGRVKRCRKRRCKIVNKRIVKFTSSPLGLLLALDDKGSVFSWKDGKFKKFNIKKRDIIDIAFETNTKLWVLDRAHRLIDVDLKFSKGNITGSVKDNKFDKKINEISFITKIKPKKFLINGNLLSTSQAKLTAASPNIILKSQSAKKLKIKELGAKGYLFDISMGRDGVLWNLTNSNVFQYSEKKKEFLRYNASNFKDKRQKFLGLPSNVTASSIISDNEGKIWVVKRNSKQVHYQKERDGKFFSVKVNSTSNITDITVDISGAVYVSAAGVYRFNHKKKKFEKMKLPNFNFLRISSGVKGSLWLVNKKGELFELLGGRIYQRNKLSSFIAQDVDMSILGEVYVTSDTHKTRANEPGNNVTATPVSDLRCNLERYNPFRKKLESTGKNTGGKAQYVAVSLDGTPWMACSPSGSNEMFRAE